MFTSIIKESLGTKIAEYNGIQLMMNMKVAI